MCEEVIPMKNTAKKLVSLLLALALLCGLAAAAAAEESTAKKFVLLGDSIPAGEGASDPSKAHARLLADEYGYDVSNFAVGGHRADDLLAVLAENSKARAALGEADIISVSIGGNDLLATNVISMVLRMLVNKNTAAVDATIAAFREKFARIIAEIKALNGAATLIIQTLYNTMEGVPPVEGAYGTALEKLNGVYAGYLAANPGAYVIADVYAAFKGREGFIYPDRIHPSDAGHAMIARVLATAAEGRPLALEPVVSAQPSAPRKVVLFLRALVDYIRYWLTQMSLWQLLRNIARLIF